MPKGKDYKHLFDVPPYYAWYFAALFSLLSGRSYACPVYAGLTFGSASFGASAYRISRDK